MASAAQILSDLRSHQVKAKAYDAWTLIHEQQTRAWQREGADDPRKTTLDALRAKQPASPELLETHGQILRDLKKRAVVVSPPFDATGPSSLFLAEAYAMGDEDPDLISLGASYLSS